MTPRLRPAALMPLVLLAGLLAACAGKTAPVPPVAPCTASGAGACLSCATDAAITGRCVCGGAVQTGGFCCAIDTWQATSCPPPGSGTTVPGGAITTQTWTAAGSPYRIMGDVYIPTGNRLTILPGVQVRFQGHYRLEGPGVIDARGTSPAQRDILFTAEDQVTGWYGIRIWNRLDNGQPPDVSDHHLENCIIEYVVKDRSRPRAFGDAAYNDSRGALYVLGETSWSAGAPENYAGLKYSDLHLNGLMLRHNRSVGLSSPRGMGAGMYFNSIRGNQPTWTDMVFDDNRSDESGAAFTQHHAGAITFRHCSFLNGLATPNATETGSGSIGYWDVSGPVTLDDVVLSGNVPAGFDTFDEPSVVIINPPP